MLAVCRVLRLRVGRLLTKLDTLPSDLDLRVLASDEHDVAVGTEVSKITCLIQAPGLARLLISPGRVLYKHFRRLLRVVQVSTSHDWTLDQQLCIC